jgi:hypothetical protein
MRLFSSLAGLRIYVMRLLSRLALLIALMLMPFGMAPSPASPTQDPMMADMAMGHCPDQGSHNGKYGFAECTMACAAALPAIDASREALLPVSSDPVLPAAAQRLHGLHPETATPPPRRS